MSVPRSRFLLTLLAVLTASCGTQEIGAPPGTKGVAVVVGGLLEQTGLVLDAAHAYTMERYTDTGGFTRYKVVRIPLGEGQIDSGGLNGSDLTGGSVILPVAGKLVLTVGGASPGIVAVDWGVSYRRLVTLSTMPTLLASDGTTVFYVQNGLLRAVPLAGGTDVQLVSSVSPRTNLLHAGGYLYWGEYDGIKRVSVTGGTPLTVQAVPQNSNYSSPLAISAGELYYHYGSVLRAVPVSGGTPRVVLESTTAFAVTDTAAYWIDGTHSPKVLFWAPITGGGSNPVGLDYTPSKLQTNGLSAVCWYQSRSSKEIACLR